jgi:hypothetical protein
MAEKTASTHRVARKGTDEGRQEGIADWSVSMGLSLREALGCWLTVRLLEIARSAAVGRTPRPS